MINAIDFNWIWIVVPVCVAFLILAVVLILVFVLRKKKHPRVKVNQEFIHEIIDALGTRKNILNASTINGRIHFEVENLELLNQTKLKELSTTGVFITNQSVKMLFSYDSELICKEVLAYKETSNAN
ncbi:MAG: hypothetical protein K2K15_01840 [Anaeroplasmataceae bacterium]|nr:hypothetical protein [Anaeroplasmataceae bacterium]